MIKLEQEKSSARRICTARKAFLAACFLEFNLFGFLAYQYFQLPPENSTSKIIFTPPYSYERDEHVADVQIMRPHAHKGAEYSNNDFNYP